MKNIWLVLWLSLSLSIELHECFSTNTRIPFRNRKSNPELNFDDSDAMDPQFQMYYQKAYQKLINDLRDNWQSPITYLKKRGYLPAFKDLEKFENYYRQAQRAEDMNTYTDAEETRLRDRTNYLLAAYNRLHNPSLSEQEMEHEAMVVNDMNRKHSQLEEEEQQELEREDSELNENENESLDELSIAEDHNEGLKDRFTGGIGNVIQLTTKNHDEALTDDNRNQESPMTNVHNWFSFSEMDKDGTAVLTDNDSMMDDNRKKKKKHKDDVVYKTFEEDNVRMCGPVTATIKFKKPKHPTSRRRHSKVLVLANKARRHDSLSSSPALEEAVHEKTKKSVEEQQEEQEQQEQEQQQELLENKETPEQS